MWMIWLRLVIFDQFEIAMGLFHRFLPTWNHALRGPSKTRDTARRMSRSGFVFAILLSPSPAAGEGGPARFSLLDLARSVLDQVRAGGQPRPTAAARRDFSPRNQLTHRPQLFADDSSRTRMN
jgi:hypothetical protein